MSVSAARASGGREVEILALPHLSPGLSSQDVGCPCPADYSQGQPSVSMDFPCRWGTKSLYSDRYGGPVCCASDLVGQVSM